MSSRLWGFNPTSTLPARGLCRTSEILGRGHLHGCYDTGPHSSECNSIRFDSEICSNSLVCESPFCLDVDDTKSLDDTKSFGMLTAGQEKFEGAGSTPFDGVDSLSHDALHASGAVDGACEQENFEGTGFFPFDMVEAGAKTPGSEVQSTDYGVAFLHGAVDAAGDAGFDGLDVSGGAIGVAAEGLPERDFSSVPGLHASTLKICDVWKDLCQHVFDLQSHFGHFFRALVCRSSRPANQAAKASPFPMPLPYPEVYGKSSAVGHIRDLPLLKIVNLQIAALNWLSLNQVREPPNWICGRRDLSKVQWEVVRRLKRLCEAWYQHADVPACSMGRAAAKQETFEKALDLLEEHAHKSLQHDRRYFGHKKRMMRARPSSKRGSVVGSMQKTDMSGAMSIVASRIKMSGKPSFDPTPFLNEETRQLYEHPLEQVNDELIGALSPPRVCVHANFKESLCSSKYWRIRIDCLSDPCRVFARALGMGFSVYPKLFQWTD